MSKTTAFRDQPINLGQQEERKDCTYIYALVNNWGKIHRNGHCVRFFSLTHMRGKFGNLNYTMNFFSVLVTMEIGNKFCIQSKSNWYSESSSILNTSGIWQQRQRSWCIEYIFSVPAPSSRFFDPYNFTFWFLCT